MSISQISVFTESKPGHLQRSLSIMKDSGVSVLGYCVSDTGEYGIARFIVDDPEKAQAALKSAGSAFTKTEVICTKLKDVPGELERVVGVLASRNININYSYSMISTYIVINVDDISYTTQTLKDASIDCIDQKDLSKLLKN